MKNRMRSVVVSAITAVAVATVLSAQTVTYQSGDWCLSYERGSLPPGVEDVTARNSLPAFRLPSIGNLYEKGPVVFYRNQNPLSYSGFVEGNTDCRRLQADFGLILLEDNGAQDCRLLPFATQYEAAADEGLNAAISMYCHNDPSVPICRLFDRYPSGWSIITRGPTGQLEDWTLFSEAARNLFSISLLDCGVIE